MKRRFLLSSTLLLACAAAALAPLASYAWQPEPVAAVDPSYLQLLHWRMVGPSRGGRVTAVAGDPVNKLVFYFGATGGGIWKTDDGGIGWHNVSDGFVRTGSVGALAVAPSNPNIVYAGMGEACVRGDASYGDGVYKSTDAGRTWTHLGLDATRSIARIRVDPKNPDLVYVAALGDPWGPSPERGVYRSKDGGRSWEKILYRSEQPGAIDLIMDASHPNVLYASTLEERRYPWGFRSAGPGTALYKTTDGGDHWTDLSSRPGLPPGVKGRIGIALAPSRPDRVWVIIDAEIGKKGVYRSDDAGQTWRHLTDDAELTMRPWYYDHIFADPKNPDLIYVLNVQSWKSTDGGEKYVPFRPPHGDSHDLWIDPQDPNRMIEGNDGGATVSFNGGTSWSSILNQPTAQIYHIAVDHQFPYHIYGAQQDNTTIGLPSRSDYGRITIEDWETVGGGEDGYIATNLENSDVIYAANHHWLTRYDRRTKQTRDISPNPETHYGWGAADINFRFWWTYPVMTSPTKPNTLYVTSQFVHRSTDEGQSWQIISPDLTRHDPKTLEHTPSYGHEESGEYWGPITREAYGPEWYATIFAFAESPKDSSVLWAGSDDGYVQVSRDSGKSWTKVTPPDLPEFALISIIEPSPHDPAEAYVAATRYKLQDNRPYLYKTSDYGKSWTKIVAGIPDYDFTRTIREDPGRPGLLYAGTETGIYVSFNDGAHWERMHNGLPIVPVHDLLFKNGDLIAATHGRGFWILDNAALYRQLNATSLADRVHVFAPPITVRFRASAEAAAGFGGSPTGSGENPPSGVQIRFYLKDKPSGPVTLKISRERNGSLEPVRTFALDTTGRAARGGNAGRGGGGGRGGSVSGPLRAAQGSNTFNWDFRYTPPHVLPGAVFQGRAAGPIAAPGTYRADLTVGGQTYTQSFEVVKDPRVAYSDAELEEQFQFMKRVSDRLEQTMATVKRIRDMREHAEQMAAQAKKEGRNAAELDAAIKALNDKLYPIEERLVQFRARASEDLINYPTGIDSKLARLLDFSSMADAPPTEGEKELYGRLSEGVSDRIRLVDQVEKTEYANVEKLAGSH
ncbi:MAG TPA: hypothetical protein VMB85_12415 [Bryobacteraceae bacterium]|nr:hypothetical protein [Bryobacteraceae bacterium]